MRHKSEIFSIFGQIDAVIAEAMIAEGKATKIEQDMIPASVLYDETGRKAAFAMVIDVKMLGEYHRRVRDLAA